MTKEQKARNGDGLAAMLLDDLAERIVTKLIERWPANAPAPKSEPAQLLDRAALARILDVSLSTVDRLVRDGCPCMRVLDARRFDVDAVKAWLREPRAATMLTPKEAAMVLAVSVDTLAFWRQKNQGPVFVKFNRGKQGNVRYARAELDRFLAERSSSRALTNK